MQVSEQAAELKRIFITGGTGFVGQALVAHLTAMKTYQLTLAIRSAVNRSASGVDVFKFDNLDESADWRAGVDGIDCVIHSAARVHVMNDDATDPLSEFRMTNVAGTLNLARQAAESGVERFIFVSSIKVNGEGTTIGKPFTADDHPNPCDPYGISKLEAEQGLLSLAAETEMEVVIIRPVLVYGPGVKANFLSMMSWLNRGIPLPLGAIDNKRSLVALDNLVDLIVTSIEHPAAANQVFLVSDGEDLSTTELLQRMGRALGKPARLLPVPASMLDFGARMLGKASIAQRLCGSLQVDVSKTRELLNWRPPVSVDDALAKTARHFLEHQAR